jgi:iron complex outermembrane recepter protein
MAVDAPPVAVQEIVVVARRFQPAPGDKAFSIVPLDDRAFEIQPRVDEALLQVPGVSLFRRTSSLTANATTQGLSLRSVAPSGAGRALVTLDGTPLNDPFGGWVIWSQLQPELLGGAEIIRGAGAGPYGAGALTGTVALSSKMSTDPVEADLSVGDLGSWRVGARSDFTIGRTGLRLAGAAQRFDGFVPVHAPDRGRADIRADFDSYTASARLASHLGAVDVAADLGHFHEGRGAGLIGADSGSDGTTGSFTALRAPQEGRPGFQIGFWGKGTNLINSSTAVAADRNSTTPANEQYATPALGFGLNGAVRGLGLGGALSWQIGADARYAEGESREHFRFLSGSFTRNRVAGGRQNLAGAYAEGSLTPKEWLFTAGLRVDRWASEGAKRIESDLGTGAVTLDQTSPDRSGIVVTGRLGVRRDFDGGRFLRAAAYSSFRPPSLNELHRPFRVGNDITEANPALSPEHLYGFELGAGLSRKGTRLGATAFFNRLVDPIANVTLGMGPGTFPVAGFVPAGGTLRQRRNVGRIDAYGLEAEAEQRITDWLSLRGAVSATHARVDGGEAAPQLTGLRPAQAPVVTATAGLVLHPGGRLTLSADARFESARFDDDLNTRRLSAGVTADARLELALTNKVSIYLSAENLFDSNLETAETADGVKSFAAPRIVRFGVHLK